MKKLYIVRHAKSDWSNPALRDFDRSLNKRGLSDAHFMGEKFRQLDLIPDKIISSAAHRAYSTSQIISQRLGYEISHIEQRKDLYLAGPQMILNIIHSFSNEWQAVMFFGHNPGLTELIDVLANVSIGNLPTCALSAIEFRIDDWKLISWGSGIVRAYEYPKKYK